MLPPPELAAHSLYPGRIIYLTQQAQNEGADNDGPPNCYLFIPRAWLPLQPQSSPPASPTASRPLALNHSLTERSF